MKLPRLDDLVDTGRHNLDSLVDGGRKGLDTLVEGGRRGASRAYRDGRHWVVDHLPEPKDLPRPGLEARKKELRRSAERGVARTRQAADERLRAPVRWIEERLMPEPRRTSSILLPSVLAVAGAGVAFWWWTSWSRGRAEAADRAALDAQGGAAGQAEPETVMAHAPAPARAPVDAPDPSAAKLSEPAEKIMAHAPAPQPASQGTAPQTPVAKATADEARLLASTAAAGLAAGVGGTVSAEAVNSLDETLAVQGSAPKGRRKTGGAA